MRDQEKRSRREELRGHIAVAALLLLSLVWSYACGSRPKEEPEVRETPHVVASRTPDPATVTQAAIVTETPAPPRVVTYEEAEGAFKEKRYGDAVDLFLVYTSDKPESLWGHYMLGLSAWKAGILAQAETSFERALEIDSSHVKSLINLSRVLLDQGEAERALERVERAVDLNPESSDALRVLGRAREEMGDTEGAIDAYSLAIVYDDNDVWSMNNLGVIYIKQGNFDEALRPLARATQLRDDVAIFQNNLGIALERTGHVEAATEAFAKAIELDPTHEKATVSFERVKGKKDQPGTLPFDLSLVAEQFAMEVSGWR